MISYYMNWRVLWNFFSQASWQGEAPSGSWKGNHGEGFAIAWSGHIWVRHALFKSSALFQNVLDRKLKSNTQLFHQITLLHFLIMIFVNINLWKFNVHEKAALSPWIFSQCFRELASQNSHGFRYLSPESTHHLTKPCERYSAGCHVNYVQWKHGTWG